MDTLEFVIEICTEKADCLPSFQTAHVMGKFTIIHGKICNALLKMGSSYPFSQQIQVLATLSKMLFENIAGKEKMLVNQHFLFSPQCFLSCSFQDKLQFFSHIYFVVCKCFQFEPVQNFTVW